MTKDKKDVGYYIQKVENVTITHNHYEVKGVNNNYENEDLKDFLKSALGEIIKEQMEEMSVEHENSEPHTSCDDKALAPFATRDSGESGIYELLFRYINNEIECQEIIRRLSLCKKRNDLQIQVCEYIKRRKLLNSAELATKGFIEAIIPYLDNFKGSKTFDNLRGVMG